MDGQEKEQSFLDKYKILMQERRARIKDTGKSLLMTKVGMVAGFFGGIFLIPVLGASAALGGAIIGAITGVMMNKYPTPKRIIGSALLGAGIGAFASVKLKFLPAMVLGSICGRFVGMGIDYTAGAARCALQAYRNETIERRAPAPEAPAPDVAATPSRKLSLASLRDLFNRKPAATAPAAAQPQSTQTPAP